MAKAILTIKPDMDAENPLEGSGWEVVSFLDRRNQADDSSYHSIGFKRKLATGTAFVLKCYRHGCEVWSLQGDGRLYHHGDWDTSNGAGLLIYKGDLKWLPKGIEARRTMAQQTIDTYSSWVNGGFVGYVLYKEVECDHGDTHREEIDSCWGFDDPKFAIEQAMEEAKRRGYDEVVCAQDGF